PLAKPCMLVVAGRAGARGRMVAVGPAARARFRAAGPEARQSPRELHGGSSGMDVETRQGVAPDTATRQWLSAFEAALNSGEAGALAALFAPDCHWRDVLAFTWRLQTVSGADAIAGALKEKRAETCARDFRVPTTRTPPRWVRRAGTECIEALFAFETAFGHGSGVLRLVPAGAPDHFRAWILLTALDELSGF